MLALLVPALINYFLDTEVTKYDTNITKFRYKLHDFSLQCLLKIGPVYPQVCCNFVFSVLHYILKQKLINVVISGI